MCACIVGITNRLPGRVLKLEHVAADVLAYGSDVLRCEITVRLKHLGACDRVIGARC